MTKAMPSEVKGILCFCREVVPVYLNRTSAKKERPKSIDIKTVNAITRLLIKSDCNMPNRKSNLWKFNERLSERWPEVAGR